MTKYELVTRPVMTPTTQWFPLSFHGEVRGELVTLQSDMYGYQSFAEYGELCKTLNGGMAVVEQSITVGDSIDVSWRSKTIFYYYR